MSNFNSKCGFISLPAVLACINLGLSISASSTEYSPPVANPYPSQVYWGDTHLHTTNSLDARSFGVTLDAEAAFRFARGEQVITSSGQPARLARPLDFLAVTDHSDAMGVMDQLIHGNSRLLQHAELRKVRAGLKAGGKEAAEASMVLAQVLDGNYEGPLLDEVIMRSVWEHYVETADQFNEPGRFTAMIGYEWTPLRSGDKLHRNVLYRGNADTARQMEPFTAIESLNPQDLWEWMQRYEEKTGDKVLALAHNGNLSNGQMFPVEINPETGAVIDEDYVKTRARWEPLYEVTQIKGDSESHPYLSPQDEFADFEKMDRGNASMQKITTPDMYQYEYAREALKNGLKLKASLGTNPYQFGMVGSTDSHTALATADENNFFGKMAIDEPKAGRMEKTLAGMDVPDMWKSWEFSASGYAAVWARENTREALFDAMKRKETYATTGPRMTVRFFGGWSFDKDDHERPDLAYHGYRNGVPMGGELVPNNTDESPTFLIAALKDPVGANLDRIQIIKGWLDADGATHEKVYNVAASDGRKIKRNKLKPLGNTVNVDQASYRNSIGDAELSVVWQDPDFDPAQSAFYYVRVLEIPTPRWTTIDAKVLGGKLPKEAPISIQERAYTSPIWYQSNL